MNKFGIHNLRDMLGGAGCQTGLRDGKVWVRAIPEPYDGGRLYAAWAVLRGRAYAVEWPKPGDLEKILAPSRRQGEG